MTKKSDNPFYVFCSKSECGKFYSKSRWANVRADQEGWFMQRNGDAWCPDHNPDWVAAWRAEKAAKKAAKKEGA